MGRHLAYAENAEHKKPAEHEGPEKVADGLGAESLDKKNSGDDDKDYRKDRGLWLNVAQTFYGRCHGHGRCDHSVGYKSACPYGCKNIEPAVSQIFEQGVESKDSALAFIVGAECYDDVFECGLQGESPDYA